MRKKKKKNLQSKSTITGRHFLAWAGFGLVLIATLIALLTYIYSIEKNKAEKKESLIEHSVEIAHLLAEIKELLAIGGAFPSVPFSLSEDSRTPTLRDLEFANAKIEQVLLLDPENEKAKICKAFYFSRIGRIDAAIFQMRKTIKEASKEDPVLYTNLGTLLYLNNERKEAISTLQKAVATDPKYGPAYNSLGQAYILDNKEVEAIEIFRKLLEIDSRFIAAYNGLGVAFLKIGRIDDARVAFESAIEKDTQYFGAVMNLGSLFLEKGDFHKALATFDRATVINKNSSRAWFELASAQYALGLFKDASKAYRMALEIKPDNSLYHIGLGYTLLRSGDVESSIDEFRTASILDRTAATSIIAGLNNLAKNFDQAKNNADAMTTRHVLLILQRELNQ